MDTGEEGGQDRLFYRPPRDLPGVQIRDLMRLETEAEQAEVALAPLGAS